MKIVSAAAEQYEKLCKALLFIVDCFPRIELYSRAFADSDLFQECLSKYYVSILRFWCRACKFYRRHRLWNFLRVVWNDYEAEFGELEVNLKANSKLLERTAHAEHMSESKMSRLEQKLVNLELLKVQKSYRHREMITWLAPTAHAADYHIEHLELAKEKYHVDTFVNGFSTNLNLSNGSTLKKLFLIVY